MDQIEEIEINYWKEVFSKLSWHNRENPKCPLPFTEYGKELQQIFEGHKADFKFHDAAVEVDCILEGQYRLVVVIGKEQEKFAHIFIRFLKLKPNGNIQICNPTFFKVPFFELKEFVKNFDVYLEELEKEFSKIPREKMIVDLNMEMIKAFLVHHFENTSALWTVKFEDDVYKVHVQNGKDELFFKLKQSNWRKEIINKLP